MAQKIYGPPSILDKIVQLAPLMHKTEIARVLGVKYERVSRRVKRYGIKCLPKKLAQQPTYGEWIGAAMMEAQIAGIHYLDILKPCRRPEVATARWRAWHRILNELPHVSIAGLSRASGFDHSAIMHGLGRLSGQIPKGWKMGPKLVRATGRVVTFERAF